MKLKCIVKNPDEKYGHMTSISESLENLQRTVGGYIEIVNFGAIGPAGIVLVVNEEGLLRDLPKHTIAGADFFGTVLVLGDANEDGDLTDCPITFQQWKDFVDWRP